ncbi:sensor histidine kinase [Undibacterium sp. JH2W]|uniref:sensor histidine kinase n=1 Tax=Undibacterium sp. JH2W TaxID=3413037 RepID=UPI003BF2D136
MLLLPLLAQASAMRSLRFQHVGLEQGLPMQSVQTIAQDAQGFLWMGGQAGLVRFDGYRFTLYKNKSDDIHSLNNDWIRQIYFDRQARMWVITAAGGPHLYDRVNDHFQRFIIPGGTDSQVQNSAVNDIIDDGQEGLWLGTENSLDPASNRLSSLRHSSTDGSSVAHDGVMAVLEDSQDRFWVGTLEGLDLLDRVSMRFRHYRHDPEDAASLGSNFVTFLFEYSQKNLWLGTGDGLSKMQTNQLGQISFGNYATNSTVDCIMEDQAGKLWLSTDAGIARFDPVSQQFRYFTGKDGLIDGGYYSSSCFRDAQHTMYFGGLNGLSSFQPAEIRENAISPPVLITGLQIFNQPQAAGKTAEGFSLQGQIRDSKAISLSYRHTVFSPEFSALHFADPQRNRYACQLLGFDKEGVYTDASRRFATYTNLDPGEYLFRVKAANKDGIWDETGAQLRITITPPYWKTWWFRVLLACILFTFLWMAYRYHLHQLLQQKKRLEVEVDKRTAEIAQQKQEIEFKTDELEKTVGVLALANKLQLEHQSELTRFLVVASHDLRQPMHALNLYLEALSMEELTGSSLGLLSKLKKCAGTMDGMFLSLLDLSRLDAQIVEPNVSEFSLALLLKKIELEFAPQAQEKSLYFTVAETQAWVNSDSDLLEQILRNLVANAIRYTHSGGIELSCTVVGQHLNLTVSDTGIGISVHQQETVFQEFFQASVHRRDSSKGLGMGLAIVKRLCNLLNIPMVLHSDLGKGSQFSLLLKQLQVPADAASALHFEHQYTSQLNGKRVIIIDDDDAILHATQSCLLQWHCGVTTGHSSAEVIHKIADGICIPDIIICDYQLAGNENGLEAIANLRDMFNHDIPALIITGDMQVEERLKNTGDAMHILYKPVSIGVLQTTLGQMVLAQRLTPKASDESLD